MLVDVSTDLDTRLQDWSRVTGQPPQVFVEEALDRSLEDWEDYMDAVRICADIDAGKMKVYTLAEVEGQLDKLNVLEG